MITITGGRWIFRHRWKCTATLEYDVSFKQQPVLIQFIFYFFQYTDSDLVCMLHIKRTQIKHFVPTFTKDIFAEEDWICGLPLFFPARIHKYFKRKVYLSVGFNPRFFLRAHINVSSRKAQAATLGPAVKSLPPYIFRGESGTS